MVHLRDYTKDNCPKLPFYLHLRARAVSNLDKAEWYVEGLPQVLKASPQIWKASRRFGQQGITALFYVD
jgi:hypothetical protein